VYLAAPLGRRRTQEKEVAAFLPRIHFKCMKTRRVEKVRSSRARIQTPTNNFVFLFVALSLWFLLLMVRRRGRPWVLGENKRNKRAVDARCHAWIILHDL
jgi:hypothetical protein